MGAEEKPPSTGCGDGDELPDNDINKHEVGDHHQEQAVQQNAKQELVFRQKQFMIREPLLE